MNKPKHAWMVRAGNDNELADLVEDKEAVAIGWSEMRDLSDLKNREQFKQRYQEVFPDDSQRRVGLNTGQVYRFVRVIHEGDYILTYDKASRELLIGLVEGVYEHRPDVFLEHYPNLRRVKWLKRVSRDNFSASARGSLGRPPTVFQLDTHLEEIHRIVTVTGDVPTAPEEDEAIPFDKEVKAKADELIADLISHLDGYDFQDLVAGVLQAMDFQATSSPPGPDRGVDIVAHPDPFGFEHPRIKVQVKHRKGSVGGPEIRSFLAVLRSGDNGLYVSTGGFTRDAMLEAKSFREPVTLLNRDGFISLLLEYYEALSPEYKARVPLRKMWIPVE
jgi:restriction system protein